MAQVLGGLNTLTAATAEADALSDIPDALIDDDRVVPRKYGTISLNIETIVVSALIFIGIFAWLEFIRSWYDHTFIDRNNFDVVYYRLWYAIFISALVLILLYIVFRSMDQI